LKNVCSLLEKEWKRLRIQLAIHERQQLCQQLRQVQQVQYNSTPASNSDKYSRYSITQSSQQFRKYGRYSITQSSQQFRQVQQVYSITQSSQQFRQVQPVIQPRQQLVQ
jgi:hypothetical protein